MAPMPISGGTFMAFGESCTDPEWQAEPVETATPSSASVDTKTHWEKVYTRKAPNAVS